MSLAQSLSYAVAVLASSLTATPATLCAQQSDTVAKQTADIGLAQTAGRPTAPPFAYAANTQMTNAQQVSTVDQTGNISGTVLDAQGDLVTGATVVVESANSADRRSQIVDDNGFFNFAGLKPGLTYHVTISAKGFED